MSALRSILASFDIQVHSEQLDAGSSKIDRVIGQLGALGVAFMAFRAIKGFAHWGEEVAKSAREIEFHAGRMEMDVDAYQKLSQVAENFGMTMENLQIANTLFTRALGNAGGVMGVLGGHSRHATAAFKSLGLSAAQFKGQKLEDILPVISDAMLKIEDPMERVTAGLNLFGHRGRSIMPMMAQGGDAIRRAFAAAVPVFEKATIEAADKATIAGKQLSRVWDNLVTNSVGQAAMLSFAKLANRLMDIVLFMKDMSKNSEIGKGVLIALGVVGVAVAGWLLVAFAPVLIPILALIAAFALLALVVDDFIVFMEGGSSVIGDMFADKGEADSFRAKVNEVWEGIKSLIGTVTSEGNMSEFGKGLMANLQAIADSLKTIKGIWDSLTAKGSFLEWLTRPGAFQALGGSAAVDPAGPASGYGLASSDRRAAARLANVAPPPTLSGASGPPTADQGERYGLAAYQAMTGQAPMVGISISAIDGKELAQKLKPVVEGVVAEHTRGTLAGVGGS